MSKKQENTLVNKLLFLAEKEIKQIRKELGNEKITLTTIFERKGRINLFIETLSICELSDITEVEKQKIQQLKKSFHFFYDFYK